MKSGPATCHELVNREKNGPEFVTTDNFALFYASRPLNDALSDGLYVCLHRRHQAPGEAGKKKPLGAMPRGGCEIIGRLLFTPNNKFHRTQ